MAVSPTTMKITVDNVQKVLGGIRALEGHQVFVGFPDTTAGRKDGPITNATLAYIHEHGSPAQNIPARPFLVPGIKSVQKEIIARFRKMADLALDGKESAVMQAMNAVGMVGRNAVVRKITEGPFSPLALSTVRARIRRRQSASYRAKKTAAVQQNLAQGLPPGAGLYNPLIDTGQLRAAITYVIRKTGRGKK